MRNIDKKAGLATLNKWGALSIICLIMLALTGEVSAQVNTATIVGTVRDSTGAVVPGATVTTISSQTGSQQTMTTGGDGQYRILNLLPGTYELRVAAQGFSSLVRSNQDLLVGTTATIDFALQVSSAIQTVEVTGAVPVIDVTQSDLSHVVATTEMDTLPILSRGFTALAALSPGVFINTSSTGSNSAGTLQMGAANTWSTGYVLDGNSITKMQGGGTQTNLAQDWIQEFSVVTQLASAEYSFASAGYVNAISRSGGDKLHGRAYGYFQNAALNAEPGFLPPSAPNKPPFSQQRIGGFLGGPLKKDRLFYFLGYEYLNNLTSVTVNVPTAFASTTPNISSGVFPQTAVTHLGFLKLDYIINPANSVHISGNIEHDLNGNAAVGASTSTVTPLAGGTGLLSQAENYQVTWDDVLSPSMLNEVRAQEMGNFTYAPCNYVSELPSYNTATALNPSLATKWGDPSGYYAQQAYTAAQVTFGCPNWGGLGESDWLGSDTVSITHGNHSVKFGLASGYRNHSLNGYHVSTDGAYTIADGDAPFNPAAANPFPNSTCTSCYPTAYNGNIVNDDAEGGTTPDPFVGVFVQDNWKVTRKLTLNLGMRWDMDFANGLLPASPAPSGQEPLSLPTNSAGDYGPRVGFAWTPFRGTTVIRGGYGKYFDSNHSNFAGNVLQNDIDPVLVGGLPEVLRLTYNSAAGNPYCQLGLVSGGCGSGVPTAYENDVQEVLAYALANDTVPNFNPPGGTFTVGPHTYTIPTFSSAIPPSLLNADPYYHDGGQTQATIGIAHQFGGLALSGDFAYVNGFGQFHKHNGNISQTGTSLNPSYGLLQTLDYTGALADYSFHVQASYRDHRRDSFQLVYTYQDAYDNYPVGSGQKGFGAGLFSAGLYGTDPFSANVDWGRSGAVPSDILNASGIIEIPFRIEVAPIASFNTGLLQTPSTSARSGSLLAPCPVYYAQCWPALGPGGTYLKSTWAGPSTFTLATRVSKSINIHERYSGKVFFEAYNLTNQTNLTSFNMNYTSNGSAVSSTFGQATGQGPRRQLQIGAEFDF